MYVDKYNSSLWGIQALFKMHKQEGTILFLGEFLVCTWHLLFNRGKQFTAVVPMHCSSSVMLHSAGCGLYSHSHFSVCSSFSTISFFSAIFSINVGLAQIIPTSQHRFSWTLMNILLSDLASIMLNKKKQLEEEKMKKWKNGRLSRCFLHVCQTPVLQVPSLVRKVSVVHAPLTKHPNYDRLQASFCSSSFLEAPLRKSLHEICKQSKTQLV